MARSTETDAQYPSREKLTGVQKITAKDLAAGGIKGATRCAIIEVLTTAPGQSFTIREAVEATGRSVDDPYRTFMDARDRFNWRSDRNDWGKIRKVAGIDTTQPNHRGKLYAWTPSELPDLGDPEQAIIKHIVHNEPPILPLEALSVSEGDLANFVGRVAGKFIGEDAAGATPDMQQRALHLKSAASAARPSSVLDAAERIWRD